MALDMPCITWWGAMQENGYGHITIKRERLKAHRFVWRECFGDIPSGMIVHHICRNKSCVNPSHLELLSRADHNREHGSEVTHCPRGHAYDQENTYVRSGKWKSRKCRACNREREMERINGKAN